MRLPERELLRITGACAALGVDGVRGDIVTAQAARALAALDGVDEVGEEHVRRAAALALAHRRRRDPLDGRMPDAGDVERALDEAGEPPDDDPPPRGGGGSPRGGGASGAPRHGGRAPEPEGGRAPGREDRQPVPDREDAPWPRATGQADGDAASSPGLPARERRDAPAPAHLPTDVLALAGTGDGPAGRRARTRGPGAGAIDSLPARAGSTDIALVASLRARLLEGPGAPRPRAGVARAEPGPPRAGAGASRSDAAEPGAPRAGGGALREHVRSGREATFVCLVVDASGSMGARRRLARVKGALIALLRDAYARRDRVAVVAFRDCAARVLVVPGAPLAVAAAALRELPTGGRTPLAAGLDAAERLIRREALREPGRRAIAVVLTDGRVADPDGAIPRAAARLGRAAAAVHVVDTEDGPVRLGLAVALARAAGGQVHLLDETTRRAA